MRHIKTPEELRRILLDGIVGVLKGEVNTSQAAAVVGLSAEVHKSVRQEWDMRCYAAEVERSCLEQLSSKRLSAPGEDEDDDS